MTKLPECPKILLEYFVDETPLDSIQMQTLIDNGLVQIEDWFHEGAIITCYILTEAGSKQVKGRL